MPNKYFSLQNLIGTTLVHYSQTIEFTKATRPSLSQTISHTAFSKSLFRTTCLLFRKKSEENVMFGTLALSICRLVFIDMTTAVWCCSPSPGPPEWRMYFLWKSKLFLIRSTENGQKNPNPAVATGFLLQSASRSRRCCLQEFRLFFQNGISVFVRRYIFLCM